MPLYTAGQRIRGSEINALPQVYCMTADLTSIVAFTTAYVNATGLAFAAEANARYLVELFLHYNAPNARDIMIAWTYPPGATGRFGADGIESGAGAGGAVGAMNRQSLAENGAHAFNGGDAIDAFAAPVTSWLIGTQPGTVQFKFAQLSAGGSTILKAGSAMRVSRMG
jgi:hypothetical protein